ncbi:MAG: putative sugar nucleotidyl transferase [Longimicrobiales bacterium]
MATPDPILVLFDDARARRWSPFAETRPVGELLFGALRLRERAEAASGRPCVAHLAGPGLEGWDEPGAPPCLAPSGVDADRPRLYWSSRAAALRLPALPVDAPATLESGGTVVGWSVPPGHPGPDADALADPERHRLGQTVEVEADLLAWPWSLIAGASRRLAADLDALHHADADPGPIPGVHRLGDHGLALADGAVVGPGVVLDLRDGPIRLEAGVRVDGPARLTGPLHLGPGSVVFGGFLARVACGPVCKLRGEIADSVFVGYANKAHDGYLGHALVGRWVNLGANTTNSDLKNSYGNVRVELPHGRVDTDLMKVGVFLGDHVKTGIGTLLTTGGVVGAGSNVFGGGPAAPRHLPAFSWCGPDGVEPFRFDKFVEIAQAAMARRGMALTPGVEVVLRRLRTAVHGDA